VGSCGVYLSDSGWGLLVCSCECGNEPVGSIEGRDFLDSLSDY